MYKYVRVPIGWAVCFGMFWCVCDFRAPGGKKARQEATTSKDEKEGREGTALLFTVAVETREGTLVFC